MVQKREESGAERDGDQIGVVANSRCESAALKGVDAGACEAGDEAVVRRGFEGFHNQMQSGRITVSWMPSAKAQTRAQEEAGCGKFLPTCSLVIFSPPYNCQRNFDFSFAKIAKNVG